MKLRELNFFNKDIKNFWVDNSKSAESIITLHAEMSFDGYTKKSFEKEINKATLIVCDGVGLYWCLMFLGKRATKISGVDLIDLLIKEKPDTKTFLWGGTEEIVQNAYVEYKKRGLNVVGYSSGYNFDEEDILKKIKNLKAKVVLVGMGGTEKQLELVNKIKKELGVTAMTVGGSFNVAAGRYLRAPKLFQLTGTEWLWRTLQEPTRFYTKIPKLVGFVLLVLREKIYE